LRATIPAPFRLAAALALAAPALVAATERSLVFDPKTTDVTFELSATGHDVHGVISLRRGEIRFDDSSGAAAGEIVLDAGSAASGNGSRDRTMRDEVLEAARFPEIRFVAERVEGAIAPAGASEIRLVGQVDLHGARHPLTMVAKVEMRGTTLLAETEFPVAFVDWGLKDPSLFVLRVDPVVKVHVSARGELSEAPAASGGL
jgi:polyisoprenoid-binding protein YceI